MTILSFRRCGIALLLGALISGCSITGIKAPDTGEKASEAGTKPSHYGNDCRKNRSGCIYEGAYEPRERDYAELEAKRLNKAALERLRRSSR